MEQLVEKVKNGDKEAYSILIQDAKVELYSIAKSKAINEEDIKDILQETILSGYLNINQLKENKYFKTWLIRILINECNKFYRNQKREKALNQHYLETVSHNKGIENNIDIEDIISELDHLEKKIFKLYYEDKYTAKEISRILGIKTNTVKSKIRRGRKKIENKYRKRFIAIIILFILTTGVVFGRDIISYIISLFDLRSFGFDNSGILEAIEEKNWYQNTNMEYIELTDEYKIKVEYLLVDEINMYIVFNFYSNIELGEYYRISLTDLKIENENGMALANEADITLNNTTGWKNIEHTSNSIRELIYIISNEFPIMNEININFSKIVIYGDEGKNITVNLPERININIKLEDKFVNSESQVYSIDIQNTTDTFQVEKAVFSETGFYAIVKCKEGNTQFILEDSNSKSYKTSRTLLNIYDEDNNFYYLINVNIEENAKERIIIKNKKNNSEFAELLIK